MQRTLLRIVMNSLAMLSLLLFVATLTMWIRSQWYFDRLQYEGIPHTDGFSIAFYSCSSRFCIPVSRRIWTGQRCDWRSDSARGQIDVDWYERYYGKDTLIRLPGFRLGRLDTGYVFHFHCIYPFVLCAILPAIWLTQNRRGKIRSRTLAGCCIHCGYDLRATPHRCPECGKHVQIVK